MTDRAIIERFYQAFGRRDHATMAASYTATAHFADPVFPNLSGARIGAMWRMLCERAVDLRIECGPVTLEGGGARTEWQAWYTYSATGRRVHNRIAATFELRDGLIQRHVDAFDLYRWARQALGAKGLMLGWLPPVQQSIRRQAERALLAFEARTGAAAGPSRPDQDFMSGAL